MEESLLLDKEHWKKYWEKYIFESVPDNNILDNYLPKDISGKSAIEIGGFPGFLSVYAYKKGFSDVSFLDFYIDPKIIRKVEEKNDIPNIINYIEGDFLKYQPEKEYDFVYSLGFAEHFDDTKDIIERHLSFAKKGGKVVIIMPNFLGINGLVQKLFDKENFKIHNLKSMDYNNLTSIAESLDISDYSIEYYKKPMIWLEPQKGVFNYLARKLVKLFSLSLKLIPFRNNYLSSYIIISFTK